jgi:hypothetical protein
VAQLHFGAGDSATFGTTGTATASVASVASSTISNVAIGDLLVAAIHSQNSGVGTITPPTGWTQYGATIGDPSGLATRNTGLFYLPVTSQAVIDALPATLTWTFSIGTGRIAGVLARATGIDLDDPEDVTAAAFSTASSASSLAVAGITTVNTTTLLVGVGHRQGSGGVSSPAFSSWLTAHEAYITGDSSISNSGAVLAYEDLSAAGATGNKTITLDAVAAVVSGFLAAFRAGAWSPPDPNEIHYTSAPDTLAVGTVRYTSAPDTLAVPVEVRPFPDGYASVTAMLAESPFYVGHRGGSADWPEMSLHGYTQAGYWGVPALEVSLGRTSDGVWFGLHDASLDRTTLGTGGGTGTTLVASAMTWAQVQAYAINYPTGITNPSALPQPYTLLEDILDAYYDSHVLLIDPKAGVGAREELIDILDALPGTPTDRIVAKYYGPSTNWAVSAGARGYTTWGYFYEGDDIATNEGAWDILGLNHDASAGAWTSILGYGKPVIAHLVEDAADAASALGKGADGLMVSGVQAVIART